MTSGELNRITHDGNGKMTFAVAGKYIIHLDFALETSVAGKHVQIGGRINTSVQGALNHVEPRAANSQVAVSISMIIDVSANDTFEGVIRTTDTGTPNIAVDHLSITALQIGG